MELLENNFCSQNVCKKWVPFHHTEIWRQHYYRLSATCWQESSGLFLSLLLANLWTLTFYCFWLIMLYTHICEGRVPSLSQALFSWFFFSSTFLLWCSEMRVIPTVETWSLSSVSSVKLICHTGFYCAEFGLSLLVRAASRDSSSRLVEQQRELFIGKYPIFFTICLLPPNSQK